MQSALGLHHEAREPACSPHLVQLYACFEWWAQLGLLLHHLTAAVLSVVMPTHERADCLAQPGREDKLFQLVSPTAASPSVYTFAEALFMAGAPEYLPG
jgi:hypothetical protein